MFEPGRQESSQENQQQVESIPPIIDQESFLKRKAEAGYVGVSNGTFRSNKDNTYLYEKSQYIVDSEEEVARDLQLLEHLRNAGIFHPGITWGAYRMTDGRFQVYAVMPRLEVYDSTKPIPEERQKILQRAPNQDDLSWQTDILSRNDSHILEWFRRLDPNYDGVRDENQLTHLLNSAEASHPSNWGWDTQSGKLYPVDMEVVSLNDRENRMIIRNWAQGRPVNNLIDQHILDLMDSY